MTGRNTNLKIKVKQNKKRNEKKQKTKLFFLIPSAVRLEDLSQLDESDGGIGQISNKSHNSLCTQCFTQKPGVPDSWCRAPWD